MKKHNFFILSLIFTFFLNNDCFAQNEQDEIAIDKTALQELEGKDDINNKIDKAFDDITEVKEEIKNEEKIDIKEETTKKIKEEIKEIKKEIRDNEKKEEEEKVIEEEKIDILQKKDDKKDNEKEIDSKEEVNEEKKEINKKDENEKIEIEEEKKVNIESLTTSDIKKLGHDLRKGSKEEKENAIFILNKLGKKASPATNDIIASIHEKKTGKEAVDILYNIGTGTAIAGLTRLISNDNKELGEYILRKIAGFKEQAQFVVDDLFANYSNKDLKEEVIFALGEIKGERSYYELREILKGTDSDKIKILALNQLLKFDDVKKDLPLFRRIFRKTAPSDFTLQLSNAIMKLEGNF